MIASQFQLRLEDRNREKPREKMTTRGSAMKDLEKTQTYKTGPPNRDKATDKKRVAFVEPIDEESREEQLTESMIKKRSMPYVDVPPLKATVRKPITDPDKDHPSRFGPSYKSRAPVEIGIDIEQIVKGVLDLEISVPLRNLAGASAAVQKEIKKQVTKARMPVKEDEETAPILLT